MTQQLSLTGVVLAGGRSKRLGQDKTELKLYAGSSFTLVEHMVALLQPFTTSVLVSGKSLDAVCSIADVYPQCGPMGGIVSALQYTQRGACLVLSCDLPLMTADCLALLVQQWRMRPAGMCMTAFVNSQGFLEPTVAIYEGEALNLLECAIAAKMYSLQQAIPFAKQHRISYTCEMAPCFTNLNTPADLAYVKDTLK